MTLDVQDTDANWERFGGPTTKTAEGHKLRGAFPQLRVVVLAECGTRALITAAVTISKVNGTGYTVDVVVGAAVAPEGDDAPDAGETDDAPTVPATAVADLAANALEESLGFVPTVDCGSGDLAIVVGAVFDCVATLDDGLDYAAPVTVTDVSATGYDIDVSVASEPLSGSGGRLAPDYRRAG